MLFAEATLADGRERDVRVEDGRIAAVEPAGTLSGAPGERVVDAVGRRLLPGAIDIHVHFRVPGFPHKETWASGSRAAVAGGVTTVVDQPNTDPPTVDGAAYDEKAGLAADSLANYGINGGVAPEWASGELFDRPLFALGEVFLADSTGNMGIDADAFRSALRAARDAGVVVTVHAEDATRFDDAEVPADPGSGPTGRDADTDRWSRYRPAAAEIAAVESAIETARDVGVGLHIAHVSTPEGVDRVRAADDAADERFSCEVTPHHLLLSRADLDDLGTFGRMNPPLRSERRRRGLAGRVADGRVDILATDHAPHTVAEKETTTWDAPSGVPGVETMLPLLLARADGPALDLQRVRDLVAATPAERFRLPDRGRVAVGAAADLTLVDLDAVSPVDPDRLHSKAGWSPFAGRDAVFPDLTLVGGTVVYDGRGEGERFGPAVGDRLDAR